MKPQDRTRAITLSGLSSTAKLVAIVLADFCNSTDSAWPSVPTLGDRCSLNERTVRRVLAEAEAEGWIQRQDRRGASSIFRLNLSALPAKPVSDTPGARSGADRDATPDVGSAPDPIQPRIVSPPPPDRESTNPGSSIPQPRIVDPPKRSEASTEASREAPTNASAREPEPQPEPTRCPSPATSPAALPLPTPTASPTSTATATPNPSPPAPTAAPPLASCSDASGLTTGPTAGLTAGVAGSVPPSEAPARRFRIPETNAAGRVALLAARRDQMAKAIVAMEARGVDASSVKKSRDDVLAELAVLANHGHHEVPAAPPAPAERPQPVRPVVIETTAVACTPVVLESRETSEPTYPLAVVVRTEAEPEVTHERKAVAVVVNVPAGWFMVPGPMADVAVPSDLIAFLGGEDPMEGGLLLAQTMAKSYKPGAVRTVRELLEVAEDALQMIPGVGPVSGPRLARHIRKRWGVEPGCLAVRGVSPKSRVSAVLDADRIYQQMKRGV